jgi:hypothetical protein
VINAQNLALVQQIVRRESLSMLNYVGDAFPGTTSRGVPALARLQELVHAHREAAGALGSFLTRKRQPVGYIGSYPTNFTTINFLSLGYLLPRLAADEARGVAQLDHDLAAITDPEAQAQVKKLLAVKRNHQQALELLAAEQGKPLAS